MILKAKIHDVEATKFTPKGKAEVFQQTYTLLDIGDGAKMKQMLEINQSVDAPKFEIGAEIIVEVTEVSSIFAGRPRLRGQMRPATQATANTGAKR
jgi:hypothetical protein